MEKQLRDEAYALFDCLQARAWEVARIYALIPYSVRRIEDDPRLQRLNRIIGKAESRVCRRIDAYRAACRA